MNFDNIEQSNKLFEEGNKEYDLGKLQSALDAYSKSIHFNPNNINAYFNRANIRNEIQDLKGAKLDFTQVIDSSPKNEIALFARGEINYKLKDYYSAVDDFTKVISLDHENEDAYFKRGLAKSKIGNFEGSSEDFSRAIIINPKFVEAIYSRGLVKMKFSDSTAEDDLKQALRIQPNYKDIYFDEVPDSFEDYLKGNSINKDYANSENPKKTNKKSIDNSKNNISKKVSKLFFGLIIITLPTLLISRYFSLKNETFICKGTINTILGKIPTTFKSENDSFSWKLDVNLTDEYGELGEYFEKKGPFVYGVKSSDGVLIEKIDKNKLSVQIYWINGTFLKNKCTLELPIAVDSIKQLPKVLPLIQFFN